MSASDMSKATETKWIDIINDTDVTDTELRNGTQLKHTTVEHQWILS